MKNLLANIFDAMYQRNLDRLAAPYRSAGDIEMYTIIELTLLVMLTIATIAMVYYWVKDHMTARRVKRVEYVLPTVVFDSELVAEKRLAWLEKKAQADLEMTQERLYNELLFRFAPCEAAPLASDAPENFFEVFYKVCPELKDIPQA